MSRVQFMVSFGYFGNFFHGLQPQLNLPTAGGALLAHLTEAAGIKPKALCFAARTDKGVHAIENIATCWFKLPFDKEKFLENSDLIKTPGLRKIKIQEVSMHVHARGNSRGKHYRYIINGPDQDTSWQIAPEIKIERIQKALDLIIGERDFKSFQASGCTAATTVKKIIRATAEKIPLNPPLGKGEAFSVQIDIFGNAFLRQMIRILVGLLAEIGTGLRKPEDILSVLAAKDRKQAGITAPAQGLTLQKVEIELPS